MLLTLILLSGFRDGHAQIDISGYLRNYNAVQNLGNRQILVGRNRLRLTLGTGFSEGEIRISNDIQNLYSESADSIEYSLREAYVDLYFEHADLRIGRQLLVWGRAEGTFVTDILTPLDLSEFLTRDFTDLRKGLTALNYTHYMQRNFIQLIVNPVFSPHELPAPDSRWFPGPVIRTSIPAVYRQSEMEAALENMQAALRFGYRSNLDVDLDLGLLYWHYPTPSYAKDLKAPPSAPQPTLIFIERYTQSLIATYSGSIQLTDRLLLTSESAYYRQRSFDYFPDELRNTDLRNPTQADQLLITRIFNRTRDGFLKKRPWLVSLAGLRYEVLDFTVGTQFVNEHIIHYDPTILQERNYYYSTLLIQRNFVRDKWDLRIFGRYNYAGKDFWINPELSYKGMDNIEAALGSQLFGGREPADRYGHLSFENFEESSFTYLSISAYF